MPFTNAPSAIDNNTLELITCVPFIQLPKLVLTAIELAHPLTSNIYTRKLLSYEYNKSNSSQSQRVLPEKVTLKLPFSQGMEKLMDEDKTFHTTHPSSAPTVFVTTSSSCIYPLWVIYCKISMLQEHKNPVSTHRRQFLNLSNKVGKNTPNGINIIIFSINMACI